MKNSEFIHDALNELEDAYIEEVENLRKTDGKEPVKNSRIRKTNRNRRKYLGLAAGICLCVFGTWIYGNFISPAEKNAKKPESIPQENNLENMQQDKEQEEMLPESTDDIAISEFREEENTDSKSAYMNFAIRFFQNLQSQENEENILVSPLSVYTALGMLESGAENETLAQLEQTLGLETEQMSVFIKNYGNIRDEKLKMANSLWITENEHFSIKDAFLTTVKDEYQADVTQLPFNKKAVKTINQWVSKHTDGTIKEILDEIPQDAVMYLVNTLFFKSEWEENYEKLQVREDTFTCLDGTKQNVDMMYSDEFYYLEDEHATGFLKYYEGRTYAFAALLPTEGMKLSDYIETLTGETLSDILSLKKEIHVNAGLPKFETEYETNLEEVLKGLGITDVFEADKADLSKLGTSSAGNIYVSRILHKTFIEVAPMGTTAGASTVIEIKEESAMDFGESKEVVLNRPFLYMIIDCESNQPIFMGTVNHLQ